MQQPIISIRMDEALKKRFELICDDLGMSISAAVTIFAKQVCRNGKIPFEITLGNDYREKKYMSQSISYNISLWGTSQNEEFNVDTITMSFDTISKALLFVKNESTKFVEEYGVFTDFAIEVINLDSHKHVLIFDDFWRYERDHKIVETIKCDEELLESDENYLYHFIEGYMNALVNI